MLKKSVIARPYLKTKDMVWPNIDQGRLYLYSLIRKNQCHLQKMCWNSKRNVKVQQRNLYALMRWPKCHFFPIWLFNLRGGLLNQNEVYLLITQDNFQIFLDLCLEILQTCKLVKIWNGMFHINPTMLCAQTCFDFWSR